ncbi:serine/threonine-protein kinase [Solimicrobium silvestre]|uniref:Protein kinase domain n=1 Tax=Solimicrobium silvestre TaxID=2099400 RepID=A0A2S9GYU7_9BURK|nr:serine/threonine-protein kinase [Solimicrobium silvestre]PRC92897.1 Protein kinase domain [Solimicrobium silvestre]
MGTTYLRRCPSCGTEHQPEIMRCLCGTPLAGVDLIRKTALAVEVKSNPTPVKNAADTLLCPFADCGQPNPAGSLVCLYCDRPLTKPATQQTSVQAVTTAGTITNLINLPSQLSKRYRITETMPARGAEAELLLVQALTGGAILVAKIYRHGILPKPEIQQRIANIAREHRVDVLEAGVSDGYAYELMELCEGGSLRRLLEQYRGTYPDQLPSNIVRRIVQELAIALAAVHATGLVHRDLKPENILIRSEQPLDLVLTDFGIASVLNATQRFTGVARTLPYAAPESLSGVIDAKADYWALGIITLEAATGVHPFAGLSDAVILHHLTTRNIATTGIQDKQINKLARGLLQRDPKLRWGASELQRWLAGDTTLADPLNEQLGSSSSLGSNFNQPYHIGEQRCHQPEQLGVALAQHWEQGVADISNGQLLAWFRDVQKDQNTVRLLLDMRSNTIQSVDVQLLKLILHLAPGIPPIWHAQSIALPVILSQANLALKGDAAAAHWLHDLYQYRVLDIYAQAGNQTAGEVNQRWTAAIDQVNSAWQKVSTIINASHDSAQAPNIDKLMYGSDALSRPPLSAMHARILAFCYDQNWAERLRQRVFAEIGNLTVNCPWLADLGDPRTMSSADLLVTENLLPEARLAAERQIKTNQRKQEQQQYDFQELKQEVSDILTELRQLTDTHMLSTDECEQLQRICDNYFEHIAQIRSSGRVDSTWLEMKKSVLRSEHIVHQLMQKVNSLSEHRAITAGWVNGSTLSFGVGLAVIALFAIRFFSRSVSFLFIAAAIGIAIWRFLPDYLLMRQIRELGQRLPAKT